MLKTVQILCWPYSFCTVRFVLTLGVSALQILFYITLQRRKKCSNGRLLALLLLTGTLAAWVLRKRNRSPSLVQKTKV